MYTQSFCFVKDGVIIKGPRKLPKSFGSLISGLHYYSLPRLLVLGFFPVRDEPPDYDPITQSLSFNLVIRATEVECVYTIQELPLDKKIKNIVAKRGSEYPPIGDWIDAQVKIASGDPDLIAEGEAQKAAHVVVGLKVKTDNPKPE